MSIETPLLPAAELQPEVLMQRGLMADLEVQLHLPIDLITTAANLVVRQRRLADPITLLVLVLQRIDPCHHGHSPLQEATMRLAAVQVVVTIRLAAAQVAATAHLAVAVLRAAIVHLAARQVVLPARPHP